MLLVLHQFLRAQRRLALASCALRSLPLRSLPLRSLPLRSRALALALVLLRCAYPPRPISAGSIQGGDKT